MARELALMITLGRFARNGVLLLVAGALGAGCAKQAMDLTGLDDKVHRTQRNDRAVTLGHGLG